MTEAMRLQTCWAPFFSRALTSKHWMMPRLLGEPSAYNLLHTFMPTETHIEYLGAEMEGRLTNV